MNIGMGEPEEKKEKAGPDETGASILRVADRYKVDPHHIYTTWPAWVLNAAIEGLPQVAAHRVYAVGGGVGGWGWEHETGALAERATTMATGGPRASWERRRGAVPAKRPGSDGPAAEAELDAKQDRRSNTGHQGQRQGA